MLSAHTIASGINTASTQGHFEVFLGVIAERLRDLDSAQIFDLLLDIHTELEGYTQSGHKKLTTVVDVIHGHLALRELGYDQK